ncbi:MAG: class I SAM-dependent methyltransferase [Cocleimonas sp.]|nr:class I SAM-dependent methyltransferase [Cocleimonas sp.]
MTDQTQAQTIQTILDKQNHLEKKLASIETALLELIQLQNLRRISDFGEIKVDPNQVSPAHFTMKTVNMVYELELKNNPKVIPQGMDAIDGSFTAGERGSPFDLNPLLTGYFQTMLKRYIFAGKVFCEGKQVLDCCCGRGWGTNILSTYGKNVYAADYDEQLIKECERYWPADNITWKYSNVLTPSVFKEEQFDVVTGMEIIEHFTKEDGITLFNNLRSYLKSGGVLIATSYFPDTRHQADNHATLKRSGHHFLWTKNELRETLGEHFTDITIIENWMVIARKK